MVTDDERDYMYLAYSADPRMRINIGIRRRLAPLVDNNRRRIELLNSLLFSFPGTPILYYGDEIGMGDNIYLGDRNGVRTPMQWNADRNAGFSRASPAKLYSPVIMDPVWGYEAVNVEAQQSDPSSLLHWMRNMIALRKLFRVFGRGTLEFLNPANRKVLAYSAATINEETAHRARVLCVANLSRFAQPVELDLSRVCRHDPVEMLGYVHIPVRLTRQPYRLTLAPYGFLLARAAARTAANAEARAAPAEELVCLTGTDPENYRSDLLTGPDLASEKLLPAYLPTPALVRREVPHHRIRRSRRCGRAADSGAAFVLLAYHYDERRPDTYQFPLALSIRAPRRSVRGSAASIHSRHHHHGRQAPPSCTTPPRAKTSARPS